MSGKPQKYEKKGWQGFWRPEKKILDVYRMERDDAYGYTLTPENTGILVPYWIREEKFKSEKEAREYFESDRVRS